jgi:hypothetical protein
LNGCFEKLERLGVEIKKDREKKKKKKRLLAQTQRFVSHTRCPRMEGSPKRFKHRRAMPHTPLKIAGLYFFNNIIFIEIPNCPSMHLIITRKHDEKTKNPSRASLILFLLLG